jgi:hypothetical protein
MKISRVSITYIHEEGNRPVCVLTTRDAELDQLLDLHVSRLKGRAEKDSSLPCHFAEPAATNRNPFDHLSSGNETEFLAVASQLALNVQLGMKGNSKEGLFVAIGGADGGDQESLEFAAILKLEVVDPVGGYMREVIDGHSLATVKRLLVRPKELQKGAYYPDPRTGSDVVVGDTMDKAALYFLRGLGLTQEMAPDDAVAFLCRRAVQRFPFVEEEEILRRFEHSHVRTADAFVEENADIFEDAEARDALLSDLTAQARPVRTINPAAPTVTRRELVAGPFKLTFPPSARAQVTINQRASDQQWETVIVTPDEPRFQ